VRVLHWHVHGSYTTSLLAGAHTYLLPVVPGRGPDGSGRNPAWDWPETAREVTPEQLRDEPVDVAVLQRPHELDLARDWLGRQVPTIYLEHNAPRGDVPNSRHPMADRDDLLIVHVTHFNALMWDTGSTPTTVVEHGVIDPGPRYTGELAHAAVAVNEPVRRGRVTGTDLLPRFARAAPLDVFGIGVERLPALPGVTAYESLPQARLHAELARRRVYLHPMRWTSLGLSLLEAMHLAMPVVALATTEAIEAVPPGAGVVSTDVEVLVRAVQRYLADPELAGASGKAAREAVLARYGLARFLADWDSVLARVA